MEMTNFKELENGGLSFDVFSITEEENSMLIKYAIINILADIFKEKKDGVSSSSENDNSKE